MATAFLVPMPRAVFYDAVGNPLVGGFVNTYIPGGTVPKTTWQDAGETTPNSNPITLDGDGSCLLYGSGDYQLTVTDALGNAVPAYSGLTGDLASASGISTAMQPVVSAASTSAAALLLGLPSVVNIAALRLLTTATSSSPVYVDGYYSGADGGEGVFWVNASDSTSTDNGGTIIVDASGRRWYREINKQPLNLLWFGAQNDPDLAIASALTAIPSGGGSIYAPGEYAFTAQVSYTPPSATASLTIFGDGADVSLLKWAGGGGLQINYLGPSNSVHIHDLSLLTGAVNTGKALELVQTEASIANPAGAAPSTITDVNIRGSDGWWMTDYWQYGVYVSGVSNVSYTRLNVAGTTSDGAYSTHGTGVTTVGTSTLFPVVHNFQGCTFNGLGGGYVMGAYTEGVTIAGCNFTGCGVGTNAPDSAVGLTQLAITTSQFNCSTGIFDQIGIGQLMISNNAIFIPQSGTGIDIAQIDRCTITGNCFEPTVTSTTEGTGLSIDGYVVPDCVVTGNSFYHIPTNAIVLGSASSGVRIQTNAFDSNGNDVVDGGTDNIVNLPVAVTSPSATNVGSAVTSLTATTASYTAPCTGVMQVFGDAKSTGTAMSGCTVSASLSGFVSTSGAGFGSGGSAAGYLPMKLGDTSTFSCAATQTSANLLVSVRCMFVPAPS